MLALEVIRFLGLSSFQPDQAQRQSGTELLKNVLFKEAFANFLMEEWKNPQYGPILGGKTVYISHGGTCMKMSNNRNSNANMKKLTLFVHFMQTAFQVELYSCKVN